MNTKATDELVSARLKSEIVRSGFTPYELAKRAGTSPQIITRFLSGERGLSLVTIDRLCLVLDLELKARER